MLDIQNLRSGLFGPITLGLSAGECVAIRGPSGAGKSLFLRALSDLDPAEGKVLLDGESREAMPGWQWRTRVAFVPAQSGWWLERVAAHFPDGQASRVQALLAEVGLPDEALSWTVERLSSGETQRLAIVRALLQRPSVLLLDEPTASLDSEATAQIEALIKRLQADGLMIIVVTHDEQQALRLSARRYWLEHGQMRPSQPAPINE